MRIWDRMNNITSIALLITKERGKEEQLVVFHLYTPMGYVESAPLFCAATETRKEMVNNTMDPRQTATNQPLEKFVETAPASNNRKADQTKLQADKHWRDLPTRARQAALSHA